jgi:type IV pilus assembly protein PilX
MSARRSHHMSAWRVRSRTAQSGMVLISAILLLLIITILAVSMFRSFGIQEKIAGNVREKQRALHAAEAAQQYAEWWLANQASQSPVLVTATQVCSTPVVVPNNAASNIPICSNAFPTALDSGSPAVLPWTIGGAGSPVGVQYTPPAMVGNINATTPSPGSYYAAPLFYISALNNCANAENSQPPSPCFFQIDAVGYGGVNPSGNGSAAVAVVESTYQITAGGFQGH